MTLRLRLGHGAAVRLVCRSECGGVAVVSSARFVRLPLPLVFWPLLWFETFITRRKEFLSISKQTVAACACFVNRLSQGNAACASASRWHVPFCPRLSYALTPHAAAFSTVPCASVACFVTEQWQRRAPFIFILLST